MSPDNWFIVSQIYFAACFIINKNNISAYSMGILCLIIAVVMDIYT